MDLKTLEARALAHREQSVTFLAEVRVRMHDRRPINDEELRDYAARFPLIQIDLAANSERSGSEATQRTQVGVEVPVTGIGYVITHRTLGVCLGQPDDVPGVPTDPVSHLWSLGDRDGRMNAFTRHTWADAQALADQFSRMCPDIWTVTPVALAAGHGDASMADCVRAGLAAWTVDSRSCLWDFKDPTGAYHCAEGSSLSEALASVRRSQEMFNPTCVYPAESLQVLNCRPLSDEALDRRAKWQAQAASRAAEQAALQVHNGRFVTEYLNAGGDQYTEEDEVADSMGRPS